MTDLERLNCSVHRCPTQFTGFFQSNAKLHRFRKTIDHMKLASFGLSDQHTTTVCTQIQRRIKRVWIRGCQSGVINHLGKDARWSRTLGRHMSRPPIKMLALTLCPMSKGRKTRLRIFLLNMVKKMSVLGLKNRIHNYADDFDLCPLSDLTNIHAKVAQ